MNKFLKISLMALLAFVSVSAFAENGLNCPAGKALLTVKFTEANLNQDGTYSVSGGIPRNWLFIYTGNASSPQDAMKKAKASLTAISFDKLDGFHCRYKSKADADFHVSATYLD